MKSFINSLKRLPTLVGIGFFVLSVSLFAPSVAFAACPTQDTSRGKVTSNFTIPSTGSYRVWSRIMPSSSTNNSYILEIDGSTCGVIVGDSSSLPVNTWTWVDYKNATTTSKIDVSLTSGNHTLTMIGREDNVELDRVVFTTDTSCIPSGNGDNCANVAVTPPAGTGGGSSGTPTGGGSSGTTTSVPIVASSNPVTVTSGTNLVVSPPAVPTGKTLAKVEYSVDGKVVGTKDGGSFSYAINTKNLAVGNHKLTTTSFYTDGTTQPVSQTVTIKPVVKKSSTITYLATGITLAVLIGGSFLIIKSRRNGPKPPNPVQTTSDPDTSSQPLATPPNQFGPQPIAVLPQLPPNPPNANPSGPGSVIGPNQP